MQVDLVRPHRIAAIGLVIANAIDAVTTIAVIHAGGYEANPWAKFLMDHHLLWPLKFIVPLSILITSIKWSQYITMRLVCAAWFAFGIYSLVITLNTITYFGKYAS